MLIKGIVFVRIKLVLNLLFLISVFSGETFLFTIGAQSVHNEADTLPDEIIKLIYNTVSTSKGETVNWELVRSFFTDDAKVILRISPYESKQFSADGYIRDFQDFHSYPLLISNGFEEKIVRMKSMVYKDMAFITTIYSAAIPGTGRPPQGGVDFWLLAKITGKWRIIAVTNEVIPPGEEVPDDPAWQF